MSNSYFSGVSNDEEVTSKIIASSADIGTINAQTIKTGSISYDSVQISGLPKTNNVLKLPNENLYVMTTTEISRMANGLLLVENGDQNCAIVINEVDTAAEATKLLELFNITDTTTTRLILISRVNTINNTWITIGTNIGSSKNVQYRLNGSPYYNSVEFSGQNSTRNAYILVYKGTAFSPATGDAIVFDLIGKG